MEFPGEDDGFYFPNMLSNSYYAWHDHDMMATLLYQEDKPFQATGSDVKMIGKCPFRIISTPWERPLLCSIWKSRCFIIIFAHTPTPTQGTLLQKGNPFFPQGIWPRLKNQSDPRRWFPHQIPAALIFLGLRVIIWQPGAFTYINS